MNFNATEKFDSITNLIFLSLLSTKSTIEQHVITKMPVHTIMKQNLESPHTITKTIYLLFDLNCCLYCSMKFHHSIMTDDMLYTTHGNVFLYLLQQSLCVTMVPHSRGEFFAKCMKTHLILNACYKTNSMLNTNPPVTTYFGIYLYLVINADIRDSNISRLNMNVTTPIEIGSCQYIIINISDYDNIMLPGTVDHLNQLNQNGICQFRLE